MLDILHIFQQVVRQELGGTALHAYRAPRAVTNHNLDR